MGDFHLGPSKRRDRFNQNEGLLNALCAHLESTHELIVLIGDVYQSDYGWRPGSDIRVRRDIDRRFPKLASRWSKPQYKLLPGNHDDFVGNPHQTIESDGYTVHLVHGHEFDPISGGYGAKLTMWLVARLRQVGLRTVSDALEDRILEPLHRLVTGDEHLGLVSQAGELHRTMGADIVVMGHSHRTACCRIGDGVYANSGVCQASSLAYVSVDTEAGTVELRRYEFESGSICLERIELSRSRRNAPSRHQSGPDGVPASLI